MKACKIETVRPAGQWNHSIIKMVDGAGEFWLNGIKVVEFQMFDDEWNTMLANSKFSDWPGFGKVTKGKIVLQDHDDKVSFRNIKIRKIDVSQ